MSEFHDSKFEELVNRLEATLQRIRFNIKQTREEELDPESQQMTEYYEWASLMDTMYKSLIDAEIDHGRQATLWRLQSDFWEDNK